MLSRLLFLVTSGLSLLLLALVVVMPHFPHIAARFSLLELFVHDVTVRRAALACALGLVVTAVVFFRSASKPAPFSDRDAKSNKRPRSRNNTVGA